MSRRRIALTGAALCCATLGFGQAPELSELVDQLRENQQALTQYRWKSRVQVALDGDPIRVELFEERRRRDGLLERTPFEPRPPRELRSEGSDDEPEGPPEPEPAEADPGPFGPAEPTDEQLLAARIAQLERLARTYRPEPRLIESLLADGSVREGAGDGENAGLMRVEAWDVRQIGDTVGLWLDADSRAPRRYEATTLIDESPVQIVIEFTRLPAGPIYAARTAIDAEIEGKKLAILTETFDYRRQGG